MCIIIHNPHGKKIAESILYKSHFRNGDGYGRLDLQTGEVLKTQDKELINLLAAEKLAAVHHFRVATVGGKTEANIHPFPVKDGWVLFMNGTVTGMNTEKDETDTSAIARLLRAVPEDSFESVLNMFNARFIVANGERKLAIRTGPWHEHDGVWYSKDDVLPGPLLAVYGTLRKGMGNHHLMRNSSFVGEGTTVERHRMCAKGIPYVIEGTSGSGKGNHIVVEVYETPKWNLTGAIDSLEGHPRHYERRLTNIRLRNGDVVKAWLYYGSEKHDDGKYIKDFVKSRGSNVWRPKHTAVTGYRTAGNYRDESYWAIIGSNPKPVVSRQYDMDEMLLDPYSHRTPTRTETCCKCDRPMIAHEGWVYCEYCGHFEHAHRYLI